MPRLWENFGNVTGKRILFIDGASRGNPGRAAIGISVTDEKGIETESLAEAIGHATNNEAEYRAVLRGMELARKHRAAELEIRTDSELLARQLKGSYRVRAENLKPLWAQARQALARFKYVNIVIIPRALNRRADALANQALDEINNPPPNPLPNREREHTPSPLRGEGRDEGRKHNPKL